MSSEAPALALLRAVEEFSRTLRETSGVVARDVGRSRGAVSIVRILERHGSLQVSDIAHALRVDISVASRQVSQLVDDGLVERAVDDADRRARSIRLSPAGRDLAREIAAAYARRATEVFADWSADDLRHATATLQRISATVAPLAPAATDVLTPA
ncbi:MarR family winged helix-turn-helix transcriptional regulator [Cellulomonas fengjieae]|uniref:MarR family winged helix-turn-helix transcriptional regulator n=1 Tax=Cellulomonas fengjieae TaxID=2819978 RepID=UPI001AAF18EB|nr:MarR family transcriptional regulator [Cellulomonas fengjieae]MBO3101854.1 MarR family transcriptional regulator [Cellulomonas fengjieae]